ncbi:MAG: hypothetical protein ABRQ38_30325, partial [Candidatus Eremiobacterota bacterium]
DEGNGLRISRTPGTKPDLYKNYTFADFKNCKKIIVTVQQLAIIYQLKLTKFDCVNQSEKVFNDIYYVIPVKADCCLLIAERYYSLN